MSSAKESNCRREKQKYDPKEGQGNTNSHLGLWLLKCIATRRDILEIGRSGRVIGVFLSGFVGISKFAQRTPLLTGCLGEAQRAPKPSLGQSLSHEGNKSAHIMESRNTIVLDHVLNPDHDTLDHPTAFSGSAGNIFCVQCAADR